jgi:hypothetical protein
MDCQILCEDVSAWLGKRRKQMSPLQLAAYLQNISSRLTRAVAENSLAEVEMNLGQAQLLLYGIGFPLGYDPNVRAKYLYEKGLLVETDRDMADEIVPLTIDLGEGSPGSRVPRKESKDADTPVEKK